ncbi:MAG: 2-hydroxyacyl-CoA dehydratase [Lachnospiraceae bacterium]|nr:2-hydroxyacyl-CoA dehydratase [Lachnospiraceae bacterium]
MDFVRLYGNIIKKNLAKGKIDKARKQIITGFKLENFRVNHLAKDPVPKAYTYLSSQTLKSTIDSLAHPEKCVWTNIFSPVEILQNFGFNCISVEAISSMISGFKIADAFIDIAESYGIASTLCSYHKNFYGIVLSGIARPAAFATTTSMVCDANINTFHTLAKDFNVPHYIVDVPEDDNEANIKYVVMQLKEMISMLENLTGKKFDMNALCETLKRENLSHKYFKEFMEMQAYKNYPNSLTLHMYTLFASHLQIGEESILKYYEMLKDEIKICPDIKGKKIFWVHLLPYYQETLKSYFNFGDDYYIQAFDMNFDYIEELDTEHPLEALAKKMINNVYNRSYQRKADLVVDLVKKLGSDGVIHFCHWGCKQSSGGNALLKERLAKLDIPVLTIDGDGIDRRNSHDGQIKTRLEAFFEVLKLQDNNNNSSEAAK